MHIFKSNDIFSCESAKTVEYLVVGGGGGSNRAAGGGGAVLEGEMDIQANLEYEIVMGSGGASNDHHHVAT